MIADIVLMIAVLGLWRIWEPHYNPTARIVAGIVASLFVLLLALDILALGAVE